MMAPHASRFECRKIRGGGGSVKDVFGWSPLQVAVSEHELTTVDTGCSRMVPGALAMFYHTYVYTNIHIYIHVYICLGITKAQHIAVGIVRSGAVDVLSRYR